MRLKLAAYIASDAQASEDWRKKYNYVGTFHNGLAVVKLNNKYGFVNTEGEEVVEPKYDEIGYFYDGLARVKLNGKWGFVNTEGVEVVEPKYTWVDNFYENIATVYLAGKTYYINTQGNLIFNNLQKDESVERTGAFFSLWKDKKRQIVDRSGTPLKKQYGGIYSPSHGLYKVWASGEHHSIKYGYIDSNAVEVVPLGTYDEVDNQFHDPGFSVVEKEKRYAIINTKNKLLVPFGVYDQIAYFNSMKILVFKRNHKYGLLNTDLKIIVKPVYDEIDVGNFYKDGCAVRLGNQWGVIDKDGNTLIPIKISKENIKSYKPCIELGGDKDRIIELLSSSSDSGWFKKLLNR